jgi:diguanylate cyclase (GGDEF)-like protein
MYDLLELAGMLVAVAAAWGATLALAVPRLSPERRRPDDEQRRLVEEESSLRRVATAVAAGPAPNGAFALVCAEAGRLLDADHAAIVRFHDPGRSVVLGRWASGAHERLTPATMRALAREGLLDRLGAAEGHDAAPAHVRIAAPISTGSLPWGALVVAARRPHDFGPRGEQRLQEYADLVSIAMTQADERARLDSQASIDQVTGLPNHRAFRERLGDEVSRARRHRRPLTVAVIDVDGFRELNQQVGVDGADELLSDLGERLSQVLREEDVLARLRGDAYALIFPESDRHQALLVADRARRAVSEAPLRGRLRATVSIGLCDLESASTADELVRRAEAALLCAKEQGRDLCWLYDSTVVDELAPRTSAP